MKTFSCLTSLEIMETQQTSGTPYPNIPPIIESDDREYRDVAST